MKKIFLLFVALVLIGCVPPAEELAGVEPLDDFEEVQEVQEIVVGESTPEPVEEVKAPFEEAKQEVNNQTVNTTTQPASTANASTQSTPSSTSSQQYKVGEPISMGEGEKKIIVMG